MCMAMRKRAGGDRSQIATIAMAAGQDYWWVTLGAITGHACCTGLAVLGGRALAGRVSMRVGKFSHYPFRSCGLNFILITVSQLRSAAHVLSWSSACCTFGRRMPRRRSITLPLFTRCMRRVFSFQGHRKRHKLPELHMYFFAFIVPLKTRGYVPLMSTRKISSIIIRPIHSSSI